jgi:hypothetical protein
MTSACVENSSEFLINSAESVFSSGVYLKSAAMLSRTGFSRASFLKMRYTESIVVEVVFPTITSLVILVEKSENRRALLTNQS